MFNHILEKIECQSCGKIMMRGNISAHMKTKICMLKNEIKLLLIIIDYVKQLK